MNSIVKTQIFRTTALALLWGFSPVLFASADPSSPAATNQLTLNRVLHLAQINNPQLRAAQSRVEAAGGRATQAAAWPNPELEFSVEEWPTDREFSAAKQTVGVSQVIPFPGKKRLERAGGSTAVQIAQSELHLQELEVLRDVKVAFYRALAANKMVEQQNQLLQLAESFAREARQRVEAGAAADQEQLRAEAALEQARAELLLQEQEAGLARADLFSRIGLNLATNLQVAGELQDSASRAPAMPEDLERHPQLRIIQLSRQQAELSASRANLETRPDVRVGIAGGQEAGTGHSIVEFKVGIPLPIFDRSKGLKKETRATVQELIAREEQVRRELSTQAAAAHLRLRSAAAQAAVYRGGVLPKAEAAMKLLQTGYDQGKFGLIDLLDTQRTVAEARLSYQKRLLDLSLAAAELEFYHTISIR
jgi:cobalt-zinc-cadmium efflux system outer membrane protein